MGYIEAYKARMIRNNDELLQLAKEVNEKDPTVEIYKYKSELNIAHLTFFKGEEINSIGFHEVPYHWSGCNVGDHSGLDNISMPFTVDDVLSTFHSVKRVLYKQPNEYYKTKKGYLKFNSYLEKIVYEKEKPICCGYFESTFKYYEWFELEEQGKKFLVMPCFPDKKIRINNCPVCGHEVRNVTVPIEIFNKYV